MAPTRIGQFGSAALDSGARDNSFAQDVIEVPTRVQDPVDFDGVSGDSINDSPGVLLKLEP